MIKSATYLQLQFWLEEYNQMFALIINFLGTFWRNVIHCVQQQAGLLRGFFIVLEPYGVINELASILQSEITDY